ncbi:GAF domain-containing protein [Hymenobacter sp. PAMC 26628]|uniref:GAF domain-containing protein n=1 Tax=Hymenobacter sp. PAMC 26628 TaxID=1484118 RepID=UPI00138F22EA|nr:GAF domain-containing protein [Hymenobacter sp. PAMC 26628]
MPLAEEQRLQALRPYQLLNTMRDETFSELVRLAAKLFNVPIGIVAFVDEEEVSLGLNYGLEPGVDLVNRGETLCSVALLREETTIFENLYEHPCDLISPFLVNRLHLGFYAGHTLRTAAGYPIGVLCVIGNEPRTFSAAESELLARLATVVMGLLDLRLHLLQQPAWNQQLWEAIYARIESSVTRLETLGALAGWEEADGPNAQAYQASAREESLRIITVLTEQMQALRT